MTQTISSRPAPAAFHIMAKPRGAICNLDCQYCYFLSKEMMYPGSRFQMADALLETYIQQYIESQPGNEVTFAWQGGEPTLMGLEFFHRVLHYQQKAAKPGQKIQNTLQTNGTLLDEDWGRFLHKHRFLVGLSLDGPQPLHDAYRVNKGGEGSFGQALRGWRLLQKHQVDCNILCTVHAANQDFPLEIYRYFRDELGASFIQFIPIVERESTTAPFYTQSGNEVTERTVNAVAYGRFLTAVFDEWVRQDVGQIFVQLFDVTLAAWLGQPGGLCIFAPTCGNALALEHNGDLFSCDHYVEPAYRLGNIQTDHLIDLVSSDQQRQFGLSKQTSLPRYCQRCEVKFACNGGCPRNRFCNTPDGEPGLNYLCAGYKTFFTHAARSMTLMANLLRQNRRPAEIMTLLAAEDAQKFQLALAQAKRNDPCPCGSGKKYKRCHGATP